MNENLGESQRVQAWIDVGGTFTDCIVQLLNGKRRRGKILSSGAIPVSMILSSGQQVDSGQPKITPSRGEHPDSVHHGGPATCSSNLESPWVRLPELISDGDQFWTGCELFAMAPNGNRLVSTRIADFRSGGWALLSDDAEELIEQASSFEVRSSMQAPIVLVHRLLQIPLQQQLPAITVRMGTTRGTNALLTRSGAKTALFVTEPFEDLLRIGDQTRPDLFSLNIVKAPDLTTLTLSVRERLAADGRVLQPLDVDQAKDQLREARRAGCESLAISLMHGYLNPVHEQQLEQLALQEGFTQISCSFRVAPVMEYVARTLTTVVDAYLSPIVRNYLKQVCGEFGGPDRVRLNVMTSSGGLIDWTMFSGKDCILSGPAGGVVALGRLLEAVDHGPCIGLDMGGTSTDVCRVAGPLECEYESTKAGIRVLTPTLAIETVAAGGGSICWFDGVSLRVGPQSAGSMPGPACYGRGGPLTITDLNVFSGRIPGSQFPFPLDLPGMLRRIDDLLEQIKPVFGLWTRRQLVDGLRRLANEQMAEAVRTVSIRQGIDPREHFLVGFGGAAGQHICEIADRLDIRSIVDHEDAGLLSAYGMGLATPKLQSSVAVYQPLDRVQWNPLAQSIDHATHCLIRQLHQQSDSNAVPETLLTAELRYLGSDAALNIPFFPDQSWRLAEDFSREHQQRFGYHRPDRSIEFVALHLTCGSVNSNELPKAHKCSGKIEANHLHGLTGSRPSRSYVEIPRQDLRPGMRLEGPALILNFGSTLSVEEGWQAEVLSDGSLWLERQGPMDHSETADSPTGISAEFKANPLKEAPLESDQVNCRLDPVLRDCFAQRLSAIATQMGHVLQQTAVSVNVKRRRDYSCAVFDHAGRLLANAPHVPVHLGAMGQTVRSVIAKFPEMLPGDAYLCNDPYEGGSHLPDLTVIVPIFAPGIDQPRLFVANRAHHADVGGIAPGSMSVLATTLGQEGMVIGPFQLACQNQLRLAELKQWAMELPYPPRHWNDIEMDLGAQVAACRRGVDLLIEYAQWIGWNEIQRYSQFLLDAGKQRAFQFFRSGLQKLFPDRSGETSQPPQVRFADSLEDGTPLSVEITQRQDGSLLIDFGGTGSVSATNFNANPSIVTAAVLYVIRTLVADELPLNDGVLETVELVIPESVLNPTAQSPRILSPAVAAGNVETSQRVVDVLLGALGAAAASQGTMNNLLFGNENFGFYETICGGAGATPTSDGASAVHTHMTNTRLTDPEVLEVNYPVRLVDFRIRTGSGGGGKHRGGDGVVRTFEFLQPVTLSLITSRRSLGPFGLGGGQSGQAGKNLLTHPCGLVELLPACCQLSVKMGSRITIETPGGGGYGHANS